MSLETDRAKKDWLDSLSNGYRPNATASFRDFLEYLKTVDPSLDSGDSILKRHRENRKSDNDDIRFYFDNLLPKFGKWLEDKGLKHNSAMSKSYQILGFFRYHRATIELQKKALRFHKTKKDFHVFKYPELVAMSQLTLEVKAILQTEIQLGLRIGDFIKLTRKQIEIAFRDVDENGIAEFEVETEKEKGVIATCHLSQTTYDLLKTYWKTQDESELAFNLSPDGINYLLKQSWERAFPDRKDEKVRFHELRAYTITQLQESQLNVNQIKAIVGKAVSEDMSTYTNGQDLRTAFFSVVPKLTLGNNVSNGNHKIENLEETIRRQQTQIIDLETRLKAFANRLESLENMRFVDVTKLVTEESKTLADIAKQIKEQSKESSQSQ